MRFFCPLILIFFLLLILYPAGPAQGGKKSVFTVGIVPQQSSSKLARKWVPILLYLCKRTGFDLRFKTAPNIPEFEKRLSNKKYDFAYMNPYHYTIFSQIAGYRAFAKQKNQRITGIIAVKHDSPYIDIKELQGKSLAFPSPAAFAASIITRSHLKNNGIDFTPVYVKSHDSVYRALAKNIYAAGGGIPRTFNNLEPNIRSQLRILWKSQPFVPHAFAAHPALSDIIVAAMTKAMLAMNDDPAARTLLDNINFSGFETATDHEWDEIRSLNIKVLAPVLH